MAQFEDIAFDPDRFSGKVRLFPLPNLVMFPHVMQPLHVFEPRYRDLTAAAVADDRLIAMAVLAEGWEKNYEGRPPLWPVACLGRIAAHQRLDDGGYNLLLLGQKRVRLVEESATSKTFRECRAELVEDVYPVSTADQRPRLKRSLLDGLSHLLPGHDQARQQFEQFLSGEVSLGILTDVIASALDLDVETKMQLLAEPDVDRRAGLLVEHVATAKQGAPATGIASGPFPPDFSLN